MLAEYRIMTEFGTKKLKLFAGNVSDLPEPVDLLVCSAFCGDYFPSPASLIGTLYYQHGISVANLALKPEVDLRSLNFWISQPTGHPRYIRIGCVELTDFASRYYSSGAKIDLPSKAYDSMAFGIRKAKQAGIRLEHIAMPILGAGDQKISASASAMAIVTECVQLLHAVPELGTITFFERSMEKCRLLANCLDQSLHRVLPDTVFISYSHRNSAEANQLADQLEQNGIKPWIDHKMIHNPDYGEDIVRAISTSKAFLLLVSASSMSSPDVLREVRNAAFYADSGQLKLWPLMLEKISYPEAFAYYLRGLDYADLTEPARPNKLLHFCSLLYSRLSRTSGD